MPFAVILRRRGKLWCVLAMYRTKHNQTTVSNQWYMERSEAAREVAYLLV